MRRILIAAVAVAGAIVTAIALHWLNAGAGIPDRWTADISAGVVSGVFVFAYLFALDRHWKRLS